MEALKRFRKYDRIYVILNKNYFMTDDMNDIKII